MKEQIRKIIDTFAQHEYSPKLIKDVHRWFIQDKFIDEKEEALQAVWKETEAVADDSTLRSLAQLYKKAEGGLPIQTIKRPRFYSLIISSAAAIALILLSTASTYFFMKDRQTDAEMVECFTALGETKKHLLPDGSIAQLNSGSVLIYPRSFDGKTRTIYLIGEANFKVTKNPNQPFIVKSSSVEIKALGTEFNVSAYTEEKDITATLIHGKVEVKSHEDNKTYILLPNEQVVYDKEQKKSHFEEANIEDAMAWANGQLAFRGATLVEILTNIERHYNVSFQYNMSKLNHDRYNVKFQSGTPLNEILNILNQIGQQFTYSYENKVYKLTIK